MSTEIALNTLAASKSLNNLKRAVNSVNRETKALVTQSKAAGDSQEAAQRKYDGMTKAIDAEKKVITQARKQMKDYDASTVDGASHIRKLQDAVSQATTRMAGFEKQQSAASKALKYQQSGLAGLQKDYSAMNKAVEVSTSRFKAEGKNASATVTKYKGLQSSLKNLKKQYSIQEDELKQIEKTSGKTSDAYKEQKVRLDQTGKALAETSSKSKSMRGEFNKLQPTGIKKIDSAVVKVKDHTGVMAEHAKESFAKFKGAAIGASVAIGTLGAGLLKGAKMASSLQQVTTENTNLLVTSGEKSKEAISEVNKMQADGRKYSIQYGESQKTIADGYQELIKRGYDGKQSVGAMSSILKASKASGDDFSDTMKVTTSTLEAFGMRTKSTSGMMKNTSKVANSLAMAADATATNFSDLGVGMSYVGTSAKSAGVSLDETASAMGILSNAGLESDKAGTGLRKTLNSLITPSKSGAKAFKEYGINVSDFKDKSGGLKPIAEIFEDMGKKIPKGKQADFFHNVFGTTGQNAAQILSQNADELEKVNKQVSGAYKNDYIGELSKKNMKTAQNQIKQFKQAGNAILIEMGGAMLPAMQKFTKQMTKTLTSKDGQKGLRATGKAIGKVANGIANMVAFIGKHTKGVKTFGEVMLTAFAGAKLIQGIGALTKALGAVGFSIGAISAPATIAVAAITGIAAVAIVVKNNWKPISKFFSGLWKDISKGASSAWKSIKKGVSGVWGSIKKGFAPIAKGIGNVWNSVKKGTSTAWNAIKKIVKVGATAVKVAALAPLVILAASIVSIWNKIKKPTMAVWNWLKSFVGGTAKAIRNTVTSWFNSLKKSVTNIWNGIKNVTSAIWNPIKSFIINIAKGIWSSVTNRFNALKNGVGKIWNGIKGVTTDVWSAISGWLGSKTKGISKTVTGVFNGLKSSLSGILESISKKWKSIWNGIASFFSDIWKEIKREAKGGINGVIGWLNGGIGGINKVIHTFGGSKNAIGKIKKLAKGGSTKGLAMVNDGAGEEAIINNGKAYKVKGKNALVKFDGDETVIPHGASKAMFGNSIKAYAKGSKNWFSKLTGWVKDKWDGLKNFIKHPIRALDGIMTKSLGKISGSELVTKLTPALGHGLVTGISSAFKKLLQKLKIKHDEADAGNAANPGGSGVQRWKKTIEKAAKKMKVNLTSAGMAAILHRIAQESNGNPTITNNWDINAKLGHPSKGLLQYIQPTLSAWVPKGTAANLSSGYAQLVAMFNDSNWFRDISVKGGWGPTGHKRFANGGLINSHGMYEIGEGNKPEMVIPLDSMKSSRAEKLIAQVVGKIAQDNPQRGNETSLETASQNDFSELNKKFDTLLAMFGQLLGVNGAQLQAIKAGSDPDKRWKYEALVQSMLNYQSH